MVYTCNPNINYLVPVLELRNIPGNIVATLGTRGTARCFWLWIRCVVKIESERKKPKSCQNCGSISIRWYSDSKSNVMNRNYFSNTSDKVGKSSYLNLHDWRFLFTERLESITKSNFFPRATVKGLQQYRGESTSKISAVAGQKFFFWGGGGGNLAERAKSRGYGTFLKFSFLKMHQILKTRQLTYIPPVQGYCVTIKNLGWMQITQISVATYS